MAFTSREVATLIWLAIAAIWLGRNPAVRGSVRGLLRALFIPVLLVPVAGMILWLLAVIGVASMIGWWVPDLSKDTVIWLLITAPILLFSATRVADVSGTLSAELRRVIGIAATLGVLVNLASFPLLVELALVPLAIVLPLVAVVAERDEKNARVSRVIQRLVVAMGLILVIYTVISLAGQGPSLNLGLVLREVWLPVWLTASALPVVYLFALGITYESIGFRLGQIITRRRRRVGLAALFASTHVDLAAVRSFDHVWTTRLAGAETLANARVVAVSYRIQLPGFRKTLLGRAAGAVADRFHGWTKPSRTAADIADTLLTLPRKPTGKAQTLAIDEFDRMLMRAMSARQNTDTKAAALLATIAVLGGSLAARFQPMNVDTTEEQVFTIAMFATVLLSLVHIAGVFWAGNVSIGWEPEEMAKALTEPITDFRQHILVNLAGATAASMALTSRKGGRFNRALGLAVIALVAAFKLASTGAIA